MATRNLGLVSTLVLARVLTPDDFGLVAIATGFIAAVEALSAVGVQDALIRESQLDREMYDTAFTMNLLRCAASAVIIALFAGPLGLFFGDQRLTPILLALAAATLAGGFENVGIVDFPREMAFHKEFRLQVTGRVIAVILTLVLAVTLHSYWALIAGIIAGRVVRLAQSYTMSPYRPRLGLARWRRIIGFSLWTWAAGLVYMVRDRLDSIVVGRMLGAGSVGIFSVASEIGSLTTTELVEPLYRALFSGFAEAKRTGLSPTHAYLRVISAVLLLTIPAAVGISLVAGPLVRLLLGAQWSSAAPLVWVLALPAAVTVTSYVTAASLNAEGLAQVNFRLGAYAAAIKLPLLAGGIWGFGLWGGALGVALSLVVEQLLYLDAARHRLAVSLADLATQAWRPTLAAAVMAAVLLACGLGWNSAANDTAAVGHLLAATGTGAAVYALTVFALWAGCGRPEGAETAVWQLAGWALRRVRLQRASPSVAAG
jgi:O-antigen/teichoic acid export membrane protein